MRLNRLSILNYKNYSETEFIFSPDVNCLTGDNGSGKTNVLDAIYYLCFCKSYFNPLDKYNIKHGESYFALKGEFSSNNLEDSVYCAVQEGKKKIFKRNEKAYTKLADHIGKYPAVIITPNDVDLIKDGSSERRKLIDGIISQYNKDYLYKLLDYNRVLNQRNNLLKHFRKEGRFDADSLEVWDMKLVDLGNFIHKERQYFIEKFRPFFIEYYKQISGESENVDLIYNSKLNDHDFEELLKTSLKKDSIIQRTSVGIHKDDLQFTIHDHPLKNTGSQGQQKSFLIALKLAQFQFIKEATKLVPILLLDDVFDKIDDRRIGFLMELVSQNSFGQIFITDTFHKRASNLFKEIDVEIKEFQIDNGVVKQEEYGEEKI